MEIRKATKYLNRDGLKNIAKTTNILRNFNVDRASVAYNTNGIFIHHLPQEQELDPIPFNVLRDWANTTTTTSTFRVHAGAVEYNVLGNWADLPTEVDDSLTSKDYDDYKTLTLTAANPTGTYYFVLRPDAPYIPTKVVPSIVEDTSAKSYATLNCTTSIVYTSDDIGRSREELVIASVEWDSTTCIASELQQLARGWNMTLGDKTNTDNHRCEYYQNDKLFYHGGRWFWEFNGTKKVLNNVAGSLESYQQMTSLTLSDGDNFVVATLDNKYDPSSFSVAIFAIEPSETDDYPPEKICIAKAIYSSGNNKCTGLYQYVCGDIRTGYSSSDDHSISKRTDGNQNYQYELHGWLDASVANAMSLNLTTSVIPFKSGPGDGIDTEYCTVQNIVDLSNTGSLQYVTNNFGWVLENTPYDVCQWITDNCGYITSLAHNVLTDIVAKTAGDDHQWDTTITGGNYSYLANQGNASRNRCYALGSSDGTLSADIDNRQLADNAAGVTLDWNIMQEYDASGNLSQDWGVRALYDSSENESLNYNARTLSNTSGTVVDWSPSGYVDIIPRLHIDAGGNGSAGVNAALYMPQGGAFFKDSVWIDNNGLQCFFNFNATDNYVYLAAEDNRVATFASAGMSTSCRILWDEDGDIGIYVVGANSRIKSDVGFNTGTYVGSSDISGNMCLVDSTTGNLVPVYLAGGIVQKVP